MGKRDKPPVVEITVTRYEVCTSLDELERNDTLIGQALRLLTDYHNPESVKQMNYIKQKIRDHYEKGFIYYLDTMPMFDNDQIVGERVVGVYITEFGMDVQINNNLHKTIVRPEEGYYRFDIINDTYQKIDPVVVLFYDHKPVYWDDDYN